MGALPIHSRRMQAYSAEYQHSRGARWVVGGEYESRHIPNFNWSFLLNYAVNLRFDWNIVFVRINVTKWGPICYLYFLILVFQHLNIIVQHFQYTTPTYILCDFNICLKNVELVFQSAELVFFRCWMSLVKMLNLALQVCRLQQQK